MDFRGSGRVESRRDHHQKLTIIHRTDRMSHLPEKFSSSATARHVASRRTFLHHSSLGLGGIALTQLLGDVAGGEPHALARTLVDRPLPRATGLAELPHHTPRVKRIIFLCMAGGPSHLESFDYKPRLSQLDGQPMPSSYTVGQPIAQLQGQSLKIQGPLTNFRQYGTHGQWVSDFFPWHQKMADDICVIKSMVTEQINHDPAHTFMNTGTAISGRPSMGAWVTYGLGTTRTNFPGLWC